MKHRRHLIRRSRRDGIRASRREARHPEYVITIDGLKDDIVHAVVRYFAPVVAIYSELGKTAGITPVVWQRLKLDEDKSNHKG